MRRSRAKLPHPMLLVFQGIALLAICGMLLPIYGPLLNPGYAEMLPEHDHVFFKPGRAHIHFYQLPVGTDQSGDPTAVAVPGPQEGGTFAGIVASSFGLLLLIAAFAAGLLTTKMRLSNGATMYDGVAVAPLPPPPKRLAAL